MRLVFLGTGGGRFVMTKQLRATGGFLYRTEGTLIHVDPGPGAIVHLRRIGIDPKSIRCVLVTHDHLDHANDAAVLVEGMTDGGRKRRGVFIGSKYVIEGDEEGNFLPALSRYHREMLAHVLQATPGEEVVVDDVHLTFLPTWHDEPTGVGVLFNDGKTKVAYLSDTGFVEDAAKVAKGADVLILNLIFEGEEDVPHTNLAAARKFIDAIKPNLVLLQHFGARIILRRRENAIARALEETFGIPVKALKDGDVIEYPKKEPKTLEAYWG